ncbi:MAG: hypothetical protein ACD_72C00064G0001 [uncultured bacterium]|nr:MAG: hypothetical protein ACD_72C00064G0001 [uncultured bacterium]
MFSILKQRTLAIYRFLNHHKPRLGAFIFVSVLFLAVYLSVGIYSSSTGHLNIFSPHAALAQATGEQDQMMGTLMTWVITLLLATATLMIKIAVFCLGFIIQIGGYNDYLNSTAVNVGWVMVRDVTNMFFVVVLLLVAFGTILGLEQYEWKKMLVKFFFAAVLVNFSRIICGVIIDISQVIMITFVNGIAATAGGNLINAFGLNKIMGLGGNASPDKFKSSDFFIASIGAVIFSSMVMAMMVAFLFILLSRMIVLWILIVLSPFAFVLSVIPETQKYASQWWSEFGNHVVIGPAIAFFLWLAFAVVGGGQINNEIAAGSATPQTVSTLDSAGIGEAMDWNSMSNFAIALGILMVGAKTSQSLGTVGGSAMGKATDMGKKIAMVATGAGAALWAGKGIAHGAKETGKWAAMNAPMIGGNRWVARGKKIAGKVGQKFHHFQEGRDEIAKDLEGDSKKLKDLKFKRDTGQINNKEYEEGLTKYKKEGGSGFAGRMWKKTKAALVETQGRDMKRGDDWMEASKAAKEKREKEYSVSSWGGGQAKTLEKEKLRITEEKSQKKGARKAAEVYTGLANQEMAALTQANEKFKEDDKKVKDFEVEAKFSPLEIKILRGGELTDKETKEYKQLSESRTDQEDRDLAKRAGQYRELRGNREDSLKKFNDLSKKPLIASALTSGIQADTIEGKKVKVETYLREELLEGGTGAVGKGYYASKATKKSMEAGHHAEEERQIMTAELKQAQEDMETLRNGGKDKSGHSINELEGTVESLQLALQNVADRLNPEGMIANARSKKTSAIEKLQNLNVEYGQAEEKATAPGVPEAEQQAAKDRMAEIDSEKIAVNKDLEGASAELEVAESAKATSSQSADFGKLTEVLEKMSKINGMDDEQTREAAIAEFSGNKGDMDMYRSMFGTKTISDTLNNRKQLGALKKIQQSLEKNKAKGTKMALGDLGSSIRHDLSHEKDHESEHLNQAWHHAAEKSPSIFAARSEALRDHEYAFYRGKKKELQNNAAQAEIWNKRGIPTPSGAAQEAVADELHGKVFKNMPQHQILAAHKSHMSYVQNLRNNGQKVEEEDTLIGLAIANKLFDEGWVDDSGVDVMEQTYYGERNGKFKAQREQHVRRKGVTPKLAPQNIENYSKGLAAAKVDPAMLAKIRNGNQAEADRFVKEYKAWIDANKVDFENKNAEQILEIILKAERDQFDELTNKIISKSSK